jgi:ubiquinone/menaquinone biosynthesis C-methylase UbiE
MGVQSRLDVADGDALLVDEVEIPDVARGRVSSSEFWTVDLPAEYLQAWERENRLGQQYYGRNRSRMVGQVDTEHGMQLQMSRTDYDGSIHQNYQEARRLPPDTRRLWIHTVRRLVSGAEDQIVLDLGSGTGRFSALLADALHAHVIGVEPSDKMQTIAMQDCVHPSVRYTKGSAEIIPLEDSSCDVVWTSMVIHHIPRLDRAAKEIHRVLRPDGKVLIRNCFKNRLQSLRFHEFFPAALAIDNERLPSVQTVKSTFAANGFRFDHFEAVEHVIDRNFSDYVERIRKRGLSTFELISDAEFEAGLRRMESAAQTEDPSRAVTEKIDLMVFSRFHC